MQAKRASRSRDASLACVWHWDEERMVVVGRRATDSVTWLTDDGSRLLVHDALPHAPKMSWDGGYNDVWVVNAIDGGAWRVMTALRGRAQKSPGGRFLLFWEEGHWHSYDLLDNRRHVLTKGLKVSFAREDHDSPSPARSYGVAGWTEGDAAVLLNDRHDLWRVSPNGSSAVCITDGYGRANDLRFRWVNLDPQEQRHVPTDRPILLSTTNIESMATGYYRDRVEGLERPQRIVMEEKSFGGLAKAKDADRIFYSLSTYRQYPDLWTASLDFGDPLRLSDTNPQQASVRWGDAELVHWHSSDGKALKGVLIKPDGFDPTRQYPMMVYFYEKLSRTLHSYGTPRPGTSPNSSYYVSNGYLWFMPDIHYEEGYPGESAMSCVVSGVQHLLGKGFVDPEAIGAAGHSWGGYQTAYLVTRTDIFKAVESGAPVSNMTSAYGGIRWGSGMSRAFQYEQTQSRIGGSLWEYPLRYLENSPVFHADKVNTPVLMLHNDKDGAVPWYQGIEYFCALRRLEKEVYMFNYVGGGHGLRRRANQMDWTVRMQQYFDHHLRGHSAPEWMENGVPYIDREREKIGFRTPPQPGDPVSGR